MTAPAPVTRRLLRWFDDSLGASRFARTALNKIFPDHWSFMVGEIALYSFVILVLTGTYLSFFFVPSVRDVTYQGHYAALRGVHMSEAYRSTLDITFQVRAGLVMRQMHHWAAIVFIGAIVVHLCRVFFTGAFRRPRQLNWMVGVALLILAIVNGFAGYSLPDDLLSGTGLRIAYSISLSIPLLGVWAAFLFFGGKFPATSIISRLFVIHIFVIPGLIVALLAAHLAIMWHQKHTQFAGPGRTEDNVVGSPLWATYAAKSVGLFFILAGVLAGLGGLAQINPIWLYGPFRPEQVSSASQPDWYMGWLEGALRIMPHWEARAFGFELPNPFFPGVLLPGITFGLLFAWPFLEERFSKDLAPHNLLDRPRDRPLRTAIGVGVLTFYIVLFAAGADDVIATTVHLSVNALIWTFRVLVLVLPPVTGVVAYWLCRDLARSGTGRRKHPVLIVRTPGGGYRSRPAPIRTGDEVSELPPEPLPQELGRKP